MYKRLKKARKALKLSQAFAARQMRLSTAALSAIESGHRKVTAKELAGFSKLYGIDKEESVQGNITMPAFDIQLSDADSQAVIDIIRRKRDMRKAIMTIA